MNLGRNRQPGRQFSRTQRPNCMTTLIQHEAEMRAIAASVALALALAAAAPARTPQESSSKSSAAQATRTHHRRYSRRHHSKRMHLPNGPTADRITEIQSALSRGGYYHGRPHRQVGFEHDCGDGKISVGPRSRFHRQARRPDAAKAGARLGHCGRFGAQTSSAKVLRRAFEFDVPAAGREGDIRSGCAAGAILAAAERGKSNCLRQRLRLRSKISAALASICRAYMAIRIDRHVSRAGRMPFDLRAIRCL